MLCHNGEINTLRGNKNWMGARAGDIHSEFFGDDTSSLLPVTSDNMSDSGNFDGVLEMLTKASPRSLPEAVMTMIPEAWQDNHLLSDAKKAFYECAAAAGCITVIYCYQDPAWLGLLCCWVTQTSHGSY
jgi:glutamate synthase (NADPH/NADH)